MNDPQPEGHMASYIGRRKFLATLSGVTAWPLGARAQQPGKVWRIGFLLSAPRSPTPGFYAAFVQGMRELGYVEGKDFIIEWRSVEGRYERFPELAAQLVRLKVDVFVTGVTAALPALKQATSTIPIVMAYSTDPVGNRLVASLVHPGGNITGLTELTTELDAKAMEMLKEVVPQATRIGVLCESHDALAGTWLAVGQARWRKTRTRAPHGVRG